MNKKFILSILIMVFTVTSIVTLTPSKVMAASYPSVFFFSDEDYENLVVTMTMAKGVNTIRMLWYPEYNNEGYDIKIYDSEKNVVATASTTFSNVSSSPRKIELTWDTSD